MREILEERQTRRYLAFILLLAAAMVAAACLLGWRQTDQMRALYFQWEGRVSSGLLGEGVEPAVIARAFAGTEVTAEGERFLLQAGYTEESTPLWLLPDLYEAGLRQVGGQTAIFGGLAILLLAGTLLFLGRRQRLYEKAAEVMGEYAGEISPDICREMSGEPFFRCSPPRSSLPQRCRPGARPGRRKRR